MSTVVPIIDRRQAVFARTVASLIADGRYEEAVTRINELSARVDRVARRKETGE